MLRARLVLDDCRYAHQQLDVVLDERQFRVYWAASCTLLRAVGHVLDKVDRDTSEDLSLAIDAAWARWSSDKSAYSLFWDFIETERNLVLKEYRRRFMMGEHMIVAGPPGAEEAHVIDSELYIPMAEGPFAGEDARDLVRDAIAWWDRELGVIEISSPGESNAR